MDNKQIDKICRDYNIKNYTINSDGSIDVKGNVALYSQELKTLPLKFNKVEWSFWCHRNKLETLEGAPKKLKDISCVLTIN